MQPREWEAAAEALRSYLASRRHAVRFEPGPDPNRAPDVVFDVDGETWAVEHTSLYSYVQGSTGELPDPAWDAMCAPLEEELEVRTRGKRKGSWTLFVMGPFDKSVLRQIIAIAAQAIANDDPELFIDQVYPGRKLGLEPDERITLKRVEGEDSVRVSWGYAADSFVPPPQAPDSTVPTLDGRHSNVTTRIDYAVSRILNAKVPKLMDLDYPRKGLLIENNEHFIEADFVAGRIETQHQVISQIDFVFLLSDDLVTQIWPKVSE